MKPPVTKTYAEASGEKPYNWTAFLNHAIANGITDEEHQAAKERSLKWVTCACGNQCSIIPRSKVRDFMSGAGAPIDEILKSLGKEFYDQIQYREYENAKLTVKAIDRRSLLIIRGILAKKAIRAAKRKASVAAKTKKAGRK